jgi:hypothetical protein
MMDLVRRMNSSLVALDESNHVLGYSAGEDAQAFLREILSAARNGWHRITIHHVCPYVMADRDKWYAEDIPLLRYTPTDTGGLGIERPLL